ncbi:MAG: hypothetical protein NVSMB64_25690 [Candidatus Velthaea sp.]
MQSTNGEDIVGKRRRRTLRGAGLVALIVAAGVAIVFLSPGLRHDAGGSAGAPFTAGAAQSNDGLQGLPLASGTGTLDMRRYRGKIVYVNFFASWCPPCNMEAPALAALARRYAPKGLVVIGVDEAEPAAKALAFRRRYNLPYPIALDADAKAGAPYGADALPTQVFFNRSGTAVHTQAGMIDETSVDSLIDGLLAAKS